MIYGVERLLRDVRVCIDQNITEEGLLREEDEDTLTLDEIIKSKLEEAVDRVHQGAPLHLLESGHNFGDAIYWGDQESGRVILPRDFMRLISFKMSDWERSVHTAISPESAEYELQRQRVKALRGTTQKPVCAIVNRPEGRVLEFYSCKSEEATVTCGIYVPYSQIRDGGIDISELCYRAVIYTAAGLTLLTLGESERGAGLLQAADWNLK